MSFINNNISKSDELKKAEIQESECDNAVVSEETKAPLRPKSPEQIDTMRNNVLADCELRMQSLEATLLTAKNDIQTLNDDFRTIITQTIALEKTISAYYYEDGIIKICRLIEHIRRIQDNNSKIIADELSSIMINTFGLSVIKPTSGELFDSICHERKDLSKEGEIIRSCVMIGWKHNEKTLIRAIVETE